jgi:hypothetical protein
MKHTDDKVCPLCLEKLKSAHGTLADWFRLIKAEYPTAHVACAYRGKEDQDKAYKDGASMVKWPNSKHNKTLPNGAACSEALDLFELKQGYAVFNPVFYCEVENHTEKIGWDDRIQCGLTIRSKGRTLKVDRGHFQLRAPNNLNRG